MPSRSASAWSSPSVSNACIRSSQFLPAATNPICAPARPTIRRSIPLARANASAACRLKSIIRASCAMGVSPSRMFSPPAGMSNAGSSNCIRCGFPSTTEVASTFSFIVFSPTQRPENRPSAQA